MPALTLLVLRTPDLGRARRFYEALGLSFTAERHGSGPDHLAAVRNGFVFELYPGSAEPTVRLGFAVTGLAGILEQLRAAGFEAGPPRPSPFGTRAVVTDPDGRRVELTEGPDQ